MAFVEWIIWAVFAAITLLMYIVLRWKRVKYRSGEYYDADIVTTLHALPRAIICETLILSCFLIVDVSKLHLIWLFPIVYFAITYWMAKRVLKEGGQDFRRR